MKDKMNELRKIAKGKGLERKFSVKGRHVRWNWERSPDNPDMARYHFVVVDDRFRQEKMNQLVESLSEINYGIIDVRDDIEEKFAGTRFRYLFKSYDSRTEPKYLNFEGMNVKKDKDLLERKKGSVEDYVSNLYNRE